MSRRRGQTWDDLSLGKCTRRAGYLTRFDVTNYWYADIVIIITWETSGMPELEKLLNIINNEMH